MKMSLEELRHLNMMGRLKHRNHLTRAWHNLKPNKYGDVKHHSGKQEIERRRRKMKTTGSHDGTSHN